MPAHEPTDAERADRYLRDYLNASSFKRDARNALAAEFAAVRAEEQERLQHFCGAPHATHWLAIKGCPVCAVRLATFEATREAAAKVCETPPTHAPLIAARIRSSLTLADIEQP